MKDTAIRECYIDLAIKMGLTYSKEKSTFRVYSPNNESLILRIYEKDKSIIGKNYNMLKNSNGIFSLTINEDLNNKFYTYVTEENLEVTDPYSVAASMNSQKSAIIDLKDTDPKGWDKHKIPETKADEAIIYELHIKDFTFSPSSATKNRGKYLGLVEENTKYKNVSTSLDHLKELGVTHVHLMPIYDYLTVDESNDKFFDDNNYNWGYDPELYNVPEGSYSTNSNDPKTRIRELKEMIMRLHENGIKVVMDVVYNHLFRSWNSNFESLSPGYYLRRNDKGTITNGSGCGSEMNTESKMFRKFILDSIEFWMKEYKIDGFRFDLMGLIDITTMEKIVKLAKTINEEAIIYGEPWTGGESALAPEKMTLKGSQKDKGFACFNDTLRDCIKGDNNGSGLGFAMGDFNRKLCVESGIAGSISFDSLHNGFTSNSSETINYVNSHDDLILWDKINVALKEESIENKKDIYKLANSIIFLSFGIPFIHEGNEFLRSKNLISNTYNGPASINEVNWNLKYENIDVFNFFKDLIALRKEIKPFKNFSKDLIKNNLIFMDFKTKPLIGYIIREADNEYFIIFHNASTKNEEVDIQNIIFTINRKFHTNYSREMLNINKVFDKNGKKLENIASEIFLEINNFGSEVFRINKKDRM